MTQKQSYQEWKECIFKDNKQPFTIDFIEQRLLVLKDVQNPEYKKFVSIYGKDYTQQIITFFERALNEAQ